MVTTDDLREILIEEEQHSPDLESVRGLVDRGTSQRAWLSRAPMLAAAAAVAAVIVATSVAGRTGHSPAVPPGPAASAPVSTGATTAPATAIASRQTIVTPDPAEVAAQQRAEAQAQREVQSVAGAAEAARVAAEKAITECQSEAKGVAFDEGGVVNGPAIVLLAQKCSTAFGLVNTPAVEWVETDLSGLNRAIGVTATPVPQESLVVVKITGTFGSNGPGIMLLVIDKSGRHPLGAQVPVTGPTPDGDVDLSVAGRVHHG